MRLVHAAGIALLLTTVSVSSPAHAGSYLSFGLGSESTPSPALTSDLHPENLTIGRLALGYRVGPLAVEAGIAASGIRQTETSDGGEALNTASASVDLKYYTSLFGPVEGYARGGLSKTWMRGSGLAVPASERAYDIGGGLQYTFGPLPLAKAAVWLDYTHRMPDRSQGETTLNAASDVMTVGVSVGF